MTGSKAIPAALEWAGETRIGAERVLAGHHPVAFEQDGSGVTASFIERKSGRHLPPQRGEALIGCDGQHRSAISISRIRRF
jgi:hypothetical protein